MYSIKVPERNFQNTPRGRGPVDNVFDGNVKGYSIGAQVYATVPGSDDPDKQTIQQFVDICFFRTKC